MSRIQRQKVRINRSRILESAVKVMELYARSKAVLEVEYFNEVGTGLGPTLEFYTLVSQESQRKNLRLWRDERPLKATDSMELESKQEENTEISAKKYVHTTNGLFPAPMRYPLNTFENTQIKYHRYDPENAECKRIVDLFKFLGSFVSR